MFHFQGDDDYMQYVNHQCSRQYFNISKVVRCHEFVYKTDSLTILNDVNFNESLDEISILNERYFQ